MMTEQEVIDLMSTSKSSEEWETNCDIVIQNCGGFPSFWFTAILQSGLMKRITARWGSTDQITVQRV